MAKKPISKKVVASKKPAAAARTSGVRNSPIPKKVTPVAATGSSPAPQKRIVTYEMIAFRAYEISQSPQCGSEFDNWLRAERELRGA